jgi:hypothetical protein
LFKLVLQNNGSDDDDDYEWMNESLVKCIDVMIV